MSSVEQEHSTTSVILDSARVVRADGQRLTDGPMSSPLWLVPERMVDGRSLAETMASMDLFSAFKHADEWVCGVFKATTPVVETRADDALKSVKNLRDYLGTDELLKKPTVDWTASDFSKYAYVAFALADKSVIRLPNWGRDGKICQGLIQQYGPANLRTAMQTLAKIPRTVLEAGQWFKYNLELSDFTVGAKMRRLLEMSKKTERKTEW